MAMSMLATVFKTRRQHGGFHEPVPAAMYMNIIFFLLNNLLKWVIHNIRIFLKICNDLNLLFVFSAEVLFFHLIHWTMKWKLLFLLCVLQVHLGDWEGTLNILWYEPICSRSSDLLHRRHSAVKARGCWWVIQRWGKLLKSMRSMHTCNTCQKFLFLWCEALRVCIPVP